jgi:hypothetical protein
LAPALTARLAAVWRRSWGVIVGNDSSAAWHSATAALKYRLRKDVPLCRGAVVLECGHINPSLLPGRPERSNA